jgi:hypothetical protein
MTARRPGSEFWDRNETLRQLSRYFGAFPVVQHVRLVLMARAAGDPQEAPKAVRAFETNECVMSALGGCIGYLQVLRRRLRRVGARAGSRVVQALRLDEELLPLRQMRVYSLAQDGDHLVLDGPTLLHLDILVVQLLLFSL